MQEFDSDETYCSQAASDLSTSSSWERWRPTKKSKFVNLRRSQRISQQRSKNATKKVTKGKNSSQEKRQQTQSQDSTQFCTLPEIAVCSQTVDEQPQNSLLKTPATQFNCKKSQIKFESIDLMADLESQTLSNEMPLNQNQFQYEMPPMQQATPFRTTVELTEDFKCRNSESGNGYQADENRSENGGLADSKDGTKKGRKSWKTFQNERKSMFAGGPRRRLKRRNDCQSFHCYSDPQNLQAKRLKESNICSKDYNSPKNCKNFTNNKQSQLNGESECKHPEPWNTNDCANIHSVKSSVNKNFHREQRSEIPAQFTERTSTKEERNGLSTICVDLADFCVENKIDPEPKMIEMNVRCPTRLGNYVPPPPMITKPIPLLRSVKNSILPKVYPPHFVNQKPPIDVSQTGMRSIDYDISLEETYPITSGWAPLQIGPECATDIGVPNMLNHVATENLNHLYCHETQITSRSPNDFSNRGRTPSECSQLVDDYEPLTSSSPSLPDSLKGIFDSDDLREILNVGRVEYRLRESHVKALSVVLDIRLEYLRDVIQHVVTLDESILEKLECVMATT